MATLSNIMRWLFITLAGRPLVMAFGFVQFATSRSSSSATTKTIGTAQPWEVLKAISTSNGDEDNADDHVENGRFLGRNIPPRNPFDGPNNVRPSKSDLYSTDEMSNLLDIHKQLVANGFQQKDNTKKNNPKMPADTVTSPPEAPMVSLHESMMRSYGDDTMQRLLDLQDSLQQQARHQSTGDEPDGAALHEQIRLAVGDVRNNGASSQATAAPFSPNYDWLDDSFRNVIGNISAIASDVDGTILTSRQTCHPRTVLAIRRAMESTGSVDGKIRHFFPATGKSRKGALNSLGKEVASLLLEQHQTPGVFLQGLYCVDGNGNVVFEQKLTREAVEAAAQLAQENSISIVGYDGDHLYTTEWTNDVLTLTERYGEPRPQCIARLADHENGMHKLLYLDESVERLDRDIRPQLEAVAQRHGARVTQAMPTMLELLPRGCSKALGVSKVCEAIGIDPSTQLLAIGDAENDVEMLKMAAIGVAVGNASPIAREASDFVLEETNDEGGAGVAIELFGFSDLTQE